MTPADEATARQIVAAITGHDVRASHYRAWRRRGYSTMTSLAVAYGPHTWVPNRPERDELMRMRDDLGGVIHEVLCGGCLACVRDAIKVIVVDQTWGLGIGPDYDRVPHRLADTDVDLLAPELLTYVLLVAWCNVYDAMDIDAVHDMAAEYLCGRGWKPADGGEAAAKIIADGEERGSFPW